MREILFRAKLINNNQWVEGYYVHTKRHHCIIADCIDDSYVVYGHYANNVVMEVVDPATVSQYTGLKDKNDKRIFEGNVVKWNDKVGYIAFDCGCFCVKYLMSHCLNRNSPAIDIVFHEYPNEIEVIGNIHDNPELLEGPNSD